MDYPFVKGMELSERLYHEGVEPAMARRFPDAHYSAARHHGLTVETVQGDMRDLSALCASRFDVVWQPYSLNYSPAVERVFREVARVLKPNGIYQVTFANPFTQALDGGQLGWRRIPPARSLH